MRHPGWPQRHRDLKIENRRLNMEDRKTVFPSSILYPRFSLFSVSLCLCVSVSLCLCVSVSLCLCVSVSLCESFFRTSGDRYFLSGGFTPRPRTSAWTSSVCFFFCAFSKVSVSGILSPFLSV